MTVFIAVVDVKRSVKQLERDDNVGKSSAAEALPLP